jgi:hypothetical protein
MVKPREETKATGKYKDELRSLLAGVLKKEEPKPAAAPEPEKTVPAPPKPSPVATPDSPKEVPEDVLRKMLEM